jgi:aminoglycoside 3-N-acetyltransferase
MKSYTTSEMKDALYQSGVRQGDVLMVHSALHRLGLLNGVAIDSMCEKIFDTFIEYLGDKGTLLVPSFYYEYARFGTPWDKATSPASKSVGGFTQYATARNDKVRSLNPIFSVSGFGYNADNICGGGSAAAFGTDSPWDRMTSFDAKILSFGRPNFIPGTYLCYILQRYGVPYMYNKLYETECTTNGAPIPQKATAFVRYLDYDLEWDQVKFAKLVYERQLAQVAPLGMGKIVQYSCKNVFKLATECLNDDLYFFLKNPPKYQKDKYPLK